MIEEVESSYGVGKESFTDEGHLSRNPNKVRDEIMWISVGEVPGWGNSWFKSLRLE